MHHESWIFQTEDLQYIQGALCSFGEEIQTQSFNIYSINVVTIQKNVYFFHSWINELLSDGNKVPRTLLDGGQGPPHINKVKQYDTELSLKVSLFIQTWRQRKFF